MEKSNKGDAREQRLSGPQRMEHREREHVRKIMLTEARNKCHETRDAYVACAKGTCTPRCQYAGPTLWSLQLHTPCITQVFVCVRHSCVYMCHRSHTQPALHVSKRLQRVQRLPQTIVRSRPPQCYPRAAVARSPSRMGDARLVFDRLTSARRAVPTARQRSSSTSAWPNLSSSRCRSMRVFVRVRAHRGSS